MGAWYLRVPVAANGSDGQLLVSGPSGEIALFFSRQGVSAIQQLERAGAIVNGSGRKVLVVYPAGREPNPIRRNPGRLLPGGHPIMGPREVWFEDCALEFLSTNDLLAALKQEISAAHPL